MWHLWSSSQPRRPPRVAEGGEDLFPDRIPRRVDAEPGVYVVELEIDGEVQRTTLEVRADPIDAR